MIGTCIVVVVSAVIMVVEIEQEFNEEASRTRFARLAKEMEYWA